MSDQAESYCQAARLLPEPLRSRALSLDKEEMARGEEFRLRVGRVPTLVLRGEERTFEGLKEVQTEELERMVETASRWSLHTVLDQVRQGFLTVEGGHRLGLCGTAVLRGGEVHSLRDITSVNLRIARQLPGTAAPVINKLRENGILQNTLILAPPGAGKTTLLRDLIRSVSQGEGGPPLRVAVADERGELAAPYRGVPQMDLGAHTDVLEGCPKAQGMLLLLRGMNPQVLAVDEITAREDVRAMEQALGCGTVLLATAHGGGPEDLGRRPLYREMMGTGIFSRVVLICMKRGERRFSVKKPEELGW